MSCNPKLVKKATEFSLDDKIQYGGYSYLRSGVKEPETVFGLVVNDYAYEQLPQNLRGLNNLQGFEIYESKRLDWTDAETLINEFDKIEYLRFDNSTFSKLPFIPDSLPALHKVYLLGLKNLDVPQAIKELSELKNLEVLGLYDIPYEQLPLAIINCNKLKAIYLGSDKTIDYEQHFEVLEKINTLETLLVDDGNLIEFPDNFVNLNLSELYLKYSKKLNYEKTLVQANGFEKLHTLEIKGSNLSALPKAVRELNQLKNLYLTDNQQLDLDNLSEDLLYLSNLETLDLASSEPNPNEKPAQPRYIPENIKTLKKLRVLKIDNFRYQDIDQIGRVCRELPNLEELSIPYLTEYETRNRLVSLPADFFESGFQKLKKLNISFNRSRIFENLKVLPSSLTHVYLNTISFEEIPEILYTLPCLQSLELREAKLTNISSDITKLENLIHLDLGENELEDLPDEMTELKNLRFLHLDGNPLVDDDEKVIRIKQLLPNTIISFYE